METLKITAKPSKSGRISICIPPELRSRKLDMIVVLNESVSAKETRQKSKYDFSGLSGRMHWKGNPVKEQRRLRNEW